MDGNVRRLLAEHLDLAGHPFLLPADFRAREEEREQHLRLASAHRRHADVWALLTAVSAITVVGLVLVPLTLGGCLLAARLSGTERRRASAACPVRALEARVQELRDRVVVPAGR